MNDILIQLDALKWRQVPDRAVSLYKQYEDKIAAEWTKEAASPALYKLFEWLNLTKGTYPGGIPNHPGPLTSMLVGGLAGAGLGYGIGRMGETILPQNWKRKNLRRTMAILGGLLGSSPGLSWGGFNLMAGNDFNDNSLFSKRLPQPYDEPLHGSEPTPSYYHTSTKLSESREMPPEWPKVREAMQEAFEKISLFTSSGIGTAPVPVNQFNQIIWNDPRVAGPLTPHMQAAATGLITGAANLPGKRNTKFVTPMDVGRMAAGMGSGYLSGALVGKALGVMMGMPSETQSRLKNTGMWAGLVANLVPIAFGA